jgi:hypothetical protein
LHVRTLRQHSDPTQGQISPLLPERDIGLACTRQPGMAAAARKQGASPGGIRASAFLVFAPVEPTRRHADTYARRPDRSPHRP